MSTKQVIVILDAEGHPFTTVENVTLNTIQNFLRCHPQLEDWTAISSDIESWESTRLTLYLVIEEKKKDEGPRCPDCGELGEMIGHMGCQYPQDHD